MCWALGGTLRSIASPTPWCAGASPGYGSLTTLWSHGHSALLSMPQVIEAADSWTSLLVPFKFKTANTKLSHHATHLQGWIPAQLILWKDTCPPSVRKAATPSPGWLLGGWSLQPVSGIGDDTGAFPAAEEHGQGVTRPARTELPK